MNGNVHVYDHIMIWQVHIYTVMIIYNVLRRQEGNELRVIVESAATWYRCVIDCETMQSISFIAVCSAGGWSPKSSIVAVNSDDVTMYCCCAPSVWHTTPESGLNTKRE